MSNSLKAKQKSRRCHRHDTHYQKISTLFNTKANGTHKKKTTSSEGRATSVSTQRVRFCTPFPESPDRYHHGDRLSLQQQGSILVRPKSAQVNPARHYSASGMQQRRARFASSAVILKRDEFSPLSTDSVGGGHEEAGSLTWLPGQAVVGGTDAEEEPNQDIQTSGEIFKHEIQASAASSPDNIASVPDEQPHLDSIARLMEGPSTNDADYDTDLEEDFPPGPEVKFDTSGRNVYLHECIQEGVNPARYVLRHLHESSFKLRHRYLNLRNIIPIAKAMKTNTCIECLDLSDNHLESDAARAVAEMMMDNCYVTKLDLSENMVRSDATYAFSKMLETNYTLKCLCLRGNQLTERDAFVLSEALKNNSTLTELDLSLNKLGELAGIYLGSGLGSNDGLTYLDLKWNSIRGKGITAIANALKTNSSLEVLDLSWNGVTQQGCVSFMKMLKVNTGLKILDLSHNHVNTIGLQKMALGIKKNENIEALLLNSNPIGDDGVLALLKSVPYCPTVKLVALQDISFSMAVHQRIYEVKLHRDICILTRDVDGHKRIFPPSHIVSMVDDFIAANQMRLLERCFNVDETRTGLISATQLQTILQTAGLNLSHEQVKSALKDVNILYSNAIQYRLLLDGLSALTR